MGTFIGKKVLQVLAARGIIKVAAKRIPKMKPKKVFDPKQDPILRNVRKETAQAKKQTKVVKKLIKSTKKRLYK